MTATIFKFPYDASRRVYSRRPRASKNGTPEERAASQPDRQPGHDRKPNHKGNNPLRARFTAISRGVTLVGKVTFGRHGFDPSELHYTIRESWLQDLRDCAAHSRFITGEIEEAIKRLGGL
ncbi:hypothetical protein [Bradyrhizobium erythrophlei]|uniref:Uncharacterized protein n=1 Tax=Bradyrhizobium erythrophlei TaxID=1437360 RepID=A0A1M5SHD8_9BRAD|nr:hypothetical protein [Bradyrhizobium erythrophlei]SHH37820.1 hypothetical protein SAMN05443248_4606 [Bradyrhizobium erythrophlei]